MNPNRNGKIACLPETIRNELNRRLHTGDRGQTLIAWLNSLPLVQEVIKKRFHGKPITAANLSEWRNGGYRDWRLENEPKPRPRPEWQARQRQWQAQPCQQQQAQHSPEPPPEKEVPDDEMLEDSQEVTDPAEVSDRLAVRLGLELSQFAETWLAGARNPRERWRRLRELLSALAQLRRGDHRAANLDITQDRWQAEVDQREADLEVKYLKDMKAAKLNPVRAAIQLPSLARSYGGNDEAWKLAAAVLETRHDLSPGTLLKPGCEPWRTGWAPGQKPKHEAHHQKRKQKPQNRKSNARRRRDKPAPVQPEDEVDRDREEIEPKDASDSNQNPGDSDPIQSDPGDFPTDSNQS